MKKTIQISHEVWEAIIKRGKFGETTEDQVLRRILGITKTSSEEQVIFRSKVRKATLRMSAFVRNQTLFVGFENGERSQWRLPDKSDKDSIRKIRAMAVAFARQNNATIGQMDAVKKALTNEGYHISK